MHQSDVAPVGGVRVRSAAGDRLRRRLVAAALLVAFGGVLGVALWLAPSAQGHGTHTKLGLAPCNWVERFDLPCATCGMTTAFSHAVRGDFPAAIRAQPMGFLLAIATAGGFLVSLHVAVTGSAVAGMFTRLLTPKSAWLLAGLFAAAWGYKILTFKGVL